MLLLILLQSASSFAVLLLRLLGEAFSASEGSPCGGGAAREDMSELTKCRRVSCEMPTMWSGGWGDLVGGARSS